MLLLRKFFYKKHPDCLLKISERVFVFASCFSSDVIAEDEYEVYWRRIVVQLQDHFRDASFMVFNFQEGEQKSQLSDILSQFDMIVMDFPWQFENCPLLPLEMIHHFLRSCESWLTLEGQRNVLLMHCERGGWPVLAFMLSGLLLYRKQFDDEQKALDMVHKQAPKEQKTLAMLSGLVLYTNQYHSEKKTLEMVYNQAPKELLHLLSPLNPKPSQVRYLQYISRRDQCSDWPPSDTPLLLDLLILRDLPHFDGRKGCRPILQVYGQDPKARTTSSSMLLFSTPKTKKHARLYQQEECLLVKLDIQCRVQGDVVLECKHLHDDLVGEEMVFRIMFHTAFVRGDNILMVQRDEMDILWDAKDKFPEDFKAEVLFSGADALVPTITISENKNDFDITSAEEFFEVDEIFSDVIDGPDHKRDSDSFVVVDTAPADSEGKEVWKGECKVDGEGNDSQNDLDAIPNKQVKGNEKVAGDSYGRTATPAPQPPPPTSSYGSPPLSPPPPQMYGAPPPPPMRGGTPPPPPPPGGHATSPPPPPGGHATSLPPPPGPRPLGGGPPTSSYGSPPPPLSPPPPQMHGAPPPPPMRGGTPPPPPPPGGHATGPPLPPGPRPPGGGPPPPPTFGARGIDPKGAGRGRGLGRPGLGSSAQKKSSLKPFHWVKVTRPLQGSLWDELQRRGQIAPEFDESEIETLFSATVQKPADKPGSRRKPDGTKPEKIHLIDLRRANNTEIMLTKVKMPLPNMTAAILAMDDSVLDVDQIENLIKFCPTKEEMELLKNYTGDKDTLGKCEQYFLELMKVPRVESKLRVFSFRIQFDTQITEFKKSLNAVNSACEEVRTSQKLIEIMKNILYLGNILNQGTARGAALGFKLDTLLKLNDTRAANNKMTLMHYLCKVLDSKSPVLLDFHKDLESLESASKIQLKSLDEEMQAIIQGLEKLNQELAASESDGPVSDVFRKTLKNFISTAESEVTTVLSLYSVVGRNADALAYYFGEDPSRYPFEQVTATLLNFIRLFKKAHEENVKRAELEKKKAAKEAEIDITVNEVFTSALEPYMTALISERENDFEITSRSLPEEFFEITSRSLPHGPYLKNSPPPPPPPSLPYMSMPSSQSAMAFPSSRMPPPPPAPPPSPSLAYMSMASSPSAKAFAYGRTAPPPPPPLPTLTCMSMTSSRSAKAFPCLDSGRGRGLARPCLGSSVQEKSSLKPLRWVKVTRPLEGSLWHPCLGSSVQEKSSLKPLRWVKVTRPLEGSLWHVLQRHIAGQIEPEFDESEIETLFSATVQKPADESGRRGKLVGAKPEKVIPLIDLSRANKIENMLNEVNISLPDMMDAVLAMDDSVLDVDQIKNLIKFFPTNEEMELLKNYTGDKATLGKCEQYFLELMKVPRVESKLRVFSFKIQFGTLITEFKQSLNVVNSACEEVRTSQKLKEIMKMILYLGNTLNEGTARGSAVGFKLDSLLKLSDTRAANSKMTLMHYLCKVLDSKAPNLLDFYKDLESLESASKIQLKSLAEEMQAIIKGLEKLNQELAASESDGPVSRKTLKDFISSAETEVATVSSLYSVVGRNVDALPHYFGEDPNRCPFEQVTTTLLNFIRLFKNAHEENLKQEELDEKKTAKE